MLALDGLPLLPVVLGVGAMDPSEVRLAVAVGWRLVMVYAQSIADVG